MIGRTTVSMVSLALAQATTPTLLLTPIITLPSTISPTEIISGYTNGNSATADPVTRQAVTQVIVLTGSYP